MARFAPLFLPVAALVLASSCASAPPPAPEQPVAEAEIPDEVVVASYLAERRERRQPPPSRKKREYLVAEKEARRLARAHPLGFRLATCEQLCRQQPGLTRSDDGDWMWVLRCALGRNIRGEPVVACREDPLAMDDYHRRRDRL